MEVSSKRDNRVLQHLLKGNTITSLQAIREFGNTRLSDTVYQLRRKGYNIQDKWIKTKNRYGESTPVKEYYLEGGM